MSTHNIGFYEDLTKIIFQLSSDTHLISSSVFMKKHRAQVTHQPGQISIIGYTTGLCETLSCAGSISIKQWDCLSILILASAQTNFM